MHIGCANNCKFQMDGVCGLKELPAFKQLEFNEKAADCLYFSGFGNLVNNLNK